MNKFKLVIVSLLLVFTLGAQAKAVAVTQIGETRIVLFDEQRNCPTGLLYAAITWQGKPLNACWRVLNTPAGPGVHIVDEEGDSGLLPVGAFQPLKNI